MPRLEPTTTARADPGAQLVPVAILCDVPVLLAALKLILVCALQTPTEIMRMGYAQLVLMVVPTMVGPLLQPIAIALPAPMQPMERIP
jgi:hypothetical protein